MVEKVTGTRAGMEIKFRPQCITTGHIHQPFKAKTDSLLGFTDHLSGLKIHRNHHRHHTEDVVMTPQLRVHTISETLGPRKQLGHSLKMQPCNEKIHDNHLTCGFKDQLVDGRATLSPR